MILNTDHITDIYLSCSWHDDLGNGVATNVVKHLDQMKIRCVGDIIPPPKLPFETERIKRIIKDCSGFIAVLPYRQDPKSLFQTSKYIISEIEIAVKLDIPILIFYESGVRIDESISTTLVFKDEVNEKRIPLGNKCYGLNKFYKIADSLISDFIVQLTAFKEEASNMVTRNTPYAFLISNLSSNFEQARKAIQLSIEKILGIPCVWSGDQVYKGDGKDVITSTQNAINNSCCIIAELTPTDKYQTECSPNIAHEIGLSKAFNKPILFLCQEPRRTPYFSVRNDQFYYWNNENELFSILAKQLELYKDDLGRNIYNYELPSKFNDYIPKIKAPEFIYNSKNRYISPRMYILNDSQKGLIIASLVTIVFSIAMTLKIKLDFSDTYDFIPLVTSIILIFYTHATEKLLRFLGLNNWARYVLICIAILLLIFTVLLTFNEPTTSMNQPTASRVGKEEFHP
jgi:hypothetical protein